MLLVRCHGLRAFSLRCNSYCYTHARSYTEHPNPPLNLDASLQAFLKDEDISLTGKTRRNNMKELEVITNGDRTELVPISKIEEEDSELSLERRSPAAYYGSRQIGAVVLPNQLQNTINAMIAESDRVQLHSDAKRLFYEQGRGKGTESNWEASYEVNKYRSRTQASRHAERDGTAFASVALPAHYSAILAVFDHVKRRLEPTWKVERVIDWGAGTGSGLWAALHSFQNPGTGETEAHVPDKQTSDSTLTSYLGIEKRDGLVSIGKRLLRHINLSNASISWQKTYKEDDRIRLSEGHDAIALSAFMLTCLPTALERKTLVKEMWESGAHVIVLIDHNTAEGFEAIADARDYLLNMGRKEFEDAEADEGPIRSSYVVAPCPHDGTCPLHHQASSRLVCGFSQRIRRPSFVRRTKHSGVGHEDIGYSYVVVRRGSRPSAVAKNLGRIGEVGRRALDKEALANTPVKELRLHEHEEGYEFATGERPTKSITVIQNDTMPLAELQEALRLEAFSWPRLVFPPLKKSGHVILDSCTAEGKIMRLIIPRSQGKQAYYDARKSSWGDIFPHPPKNPPQERHQPERVKRGNGATPITGSDIGKRDKPHKKKNRVSYELVSERLNDDKRLRRGRIRALNLEDR